MSSIVLDQIADTSIRVSRRESDGAIMVEADDLAEGVMDYDGVRELITPEAVEAYRPYIAHLTVTYGHPIDEVTPDSFAQHAAGNVDGDPQIVTQPGGWTAVRAKHILRRRDAVSAAEEHLAGGRKLRGVSLGHIPIRDNVSGTHPVFGRFDRRRIGCVSVNHVALCGETDALPPPRGKNCGIYLDSSPIRSANMKRPSTRAEWRAFFAQDAVTARLHAICPGRKPGAQDSVKDALNLEELAAEVQAAMADPESLAAILVHAIVNKPAEVAEIKMGEEPVIEEEEELPDAYGAMMDAKIAAALKTRDAQIASLLADKAARDSASNAMQDAELRRLAGLHGVRDAASLPIEQLVPAVADRLALAIDGLSDARAFVQATAAKRATLAPPVRSIRTNDHASSSTPACEDVI